ncbi:MAG TPA: UDP-glucose/GDP-mannose dehydrogenase family protein [Saprospiraceae bacterium]|nr:UDP-glucose/GDP-mannose dehydrogenase family protein [Saprospiraceae bacterium]
MKIAVVGTGYVGLVTGVCFAETGNDVTCIDIDQDKVKSLQQGRITIYEPGLEILFQRNQEQDRLHFTSSLADGIREAQIIFLALPTPPGADGSADLSFVLGVAEDLSKIITTYKVIVDKSTVPVGTAERVHAVLAKNLSPDLFDVVSNPEFLREGVAVEDFMKPDRVVIGTSSDRARQVMERLYKPFVRQGNPILYMDERSAEMTKYAANAYLAARISFMNEIANLCEKTGANVDHVRRGIGSDTRIGKRFLFPGVGYGGSCFPKDVQALHLASKEHEYDFKILDAVMNVNDRQKHILAEKIKSFFNQNLHGKKIAVWGLAFKPNTDDVREAPAMHIIADLLEAGATVMATDPEAIPNFQKFFSGEIEYTEDMYDVLDGADALAIITEWNEFRTPDFTQMKNRMIQPVIFDGRNIYDLEDIPSDFYYSSIGRTFIQPK